MIENLRGTPRALRPDVLVAPTLTLIAFVVAASMFFAIIGQPPLKTLADLWQFAMGDGFSRRETLIKTAPILLCALATAIPGRLGLISVGAEGQLHAGAIAGTAVVLVQQDWPSAILLPAMLCAAMLSGALWGGIAGVLRAGLEVNETITTLVLNYVAVLMVSALVYGAWRDPGNLGVAGHRAVSRRRETARLARHARSSRVLDDAINSECSPCFYNPTVAGATDRRTGDRRQIFKPPEHRVRPRYFETSAHGSVRSGLIEFHSQ